MYRTLPALALLVGCSAAPAPEPAPAPAPAPPPTTFAVPAPDVAPTTIIVPTQAPATGTSWAMPDLVGKNLQDAQDELQRHTNYGVLISTSSDAKGEGRAQVIDRNWKVCGQTPAAGSPITSTTVPDLAVVRIDESC
jgi:hypothetical protein